MNDSHGQICNPAGISYRRDLGFTVSPFLCGAQPTWEFAVHEHREKFCEITAEELMHKLYLKRLREGEEKSGKEPI
jgi:hypothetical protein